MNTKTARSFSRAGLAIIAAVAVAGVTMTFVRAFNPQPDPPGDVYSLIGLLDTQSIELTVSNVAVSSSRAFPPDPYCVGTLTLSDMNGDVVAHKPFRLAAGHSEILSFTPLRESGDFAAGMRSYLVPAVSYQKAGGELGRPSTDSCISGLSIVGATGDTTLFTNPGVAHAALTGNHNETLVVDTDR